jgi:hypothetical protein
MGMLPIAELRHEVSSLLNCYPGFVYRGSAELAPGEIPVFVFHTVAPAELGAQLEYLAENGYRTLSLDEFLDTQAGRRPPGPREVLLTFDDARTSFWLYAFPVLKRHQAKATLFAITGWTPDHPARPNLEDAWAGRTTLEALADLDPDDSGVCSWDELRRMHASGLVCVDSHSHLHRRVFTGRELRGVIRPDADFSPSNAAHSPYLSLDDAPLALPVTDYIGRPLLDARGFMEDGPATRIRDEAAREFQQRAGGLEALPAAQAKAKDLARLQAWLSPDSFISVSAEQLEREMRDDLGRARDCLRSELRDPDAGKTLCLPFTLGGAAVVRAARDIGLQGIFWGVLPHRRVNRPGLDPMEFVRIKNDFLWLLPGAGRRSLAGTYILKARRRFAGERPY